MRKFTGLSSAQIRTQIRDFPGEKNSLESWSMLVRERCFRTDPADNSVKACKNNLRELQRNMFYLEQAVDHESQLGLEVFYRIPPHEVNVKGNVISEQSKINLRAL